MTAVSASAPGKIILFGEHAVVYGRPAIAVPVTQVSARVVVSPFPQGEPGQALVQAPDIGLHTELDHLASDHPIRRAITLAFTELGITHPIAFRLRVASTIPVAAGLGSGAAVTVAILRALSDFLRAPLADEHISALTFEVEKLHHGTPSGIDNTVVTFGAPVYFIRDQPIVRLRVGARFTIVIADTGVQSPTALTVGDVRRAWQADPQTYEAMFDAAGEIAQKSRRAIEAGEIEALGPLMDANHEILQRMGVSSPELDGLVAQARLAGALGAKLSGGGRGGNMIALVDPQTAQNVADALLAVGAKRTIITTVPMGA